MDLDGYIRFIVALVFVLGLIGLLTWLVRKLGIGGKVAAASARGGALGGAKGARLSVVEAATLDGRRKLVLIRRDGREHLVILGANGETVVERGIEPPAAALDEAGEKPRTDFRSILGGLAGANAAPAEAHVPKHAPDQAPDHVPDHAPVPEPDAEPAAKPAKSRAARRSRRAAARKAS